MGCCWPTPVESYQPEQEGTMPAPVARAPSEISLGDIFDLHKTAYHDVSSKVEAPPVTRAPSEISLGDIFDRYKTAHPERFRTFDDPAPPCQAIPPDPPSPPIIPLQRKNHITHIT
jgi:hypothetical protein